MYESYCHADPPDLHIPVAVLLHQLVPEVVEGCPGLLVRRLHRLLQAHSHDAVALEVELEMKVHELFPITEKAPSKASWFKAPTSTFTLRQYDRH